jgi:two-component system response regulator HydG
MIRDKASILVVDDVLDTLEVLERNLSSAGYRVYTARCVVEAIELLEKTPVDLVVTDLKMPKISGLELVRHVRENLKDTEVIVITGYATIGGAVEAVKSGAEEYLTKPFTNVELFAAVEQALDKLEMRRAMASGPEVPMSPKFNIIGDSPVMRRVYSAIEKASAATATVLISGESGTGKELVARAIHYHSLRASAPFVPINCGAIPGELVESELFGHVKGAFTGAMESRAGFFQTADGGSIFLDEISEMSFSTQVKLLRVLEDKEVRMVGSSRTNKVDVRILTATNKDIMSMVKKGAFREDLYFRLGVITIAVPPLREREKDILLLARHFISKFSAEAGVSAPEFSERALNALKNYAWPGNVRELENLIQRLIVMKEGSLIDVPDLPDHMRFSIDLGNGLNRTLAQVEREHIRNVLAGTGGNKTQTAKILGIDRKTLREKLKALSEPDEH